VTVTAPPRPPRPSDPVDREEVEALVEALIEEARQRARRRRIRSAFGPPIEGLDRLGRRRQRVQAIQPPAAVADGLRVDAKFPQLDDGRSAPADRVRGERQHERHAVCLSERLSVAQDSVVPRCRLDGKARGFEPADELTHVFPHLAPRQVCREKYGVRRAAVLGETTLEEISACPPAALISAPSARATPGTWIPVAARPRYRSAMTTGARKSPACALRASQSGLTGERPMPAAAGVPEHVLSTVRDVRATHGTADEA
jgi:hypothetical protein